MMKSKTKNNLNFDVLSWSTRKMCLLQLLLGAQVVSVSTFLLTAIGCSWVETSIALTTYHLVTVVFLGQQTKGWFNNTTAKTQHQVQCRF